jgi:hypothetical protein
LSGQEFDARGCLTPAGLARLAAAPPGRAPEALASHLATCGRCQDRMLARLRPAGERRVARRPPLWRALVVVVALIVLVLVALTLARRFAAA